MICSDVILIILSFEGILPRHATVCSTFYLAGLLMMDIWHKWMDNHYPLWNRTKNRSILKYLLNRAYIYHPDAFLWIKNTCPNSMEGIIKLVIHTCNMDKRSEHQYFGIANKHDIDYWNQINDRFLLDGGGLYIELNLHKHKYINRQYHIEDTTRSPTTRLAMCIAKGAPIPDNIELQTDRCLFFKNVTHYCRIILPSHPEDIIYYVEVNIGRRYIYVDIEGSEVSIFMKHKNGCTTLNGCSYNGRFTFDDPDDDRYCNKVLKIHNSIDSVFQSDNPCKLILWLLKHRIM